MLHEIHTSGFDSSEMREDKDRMPTAASRERKLFEQLLDLRTRVYAQAQKLSERWKPYIKRGGFTYSAFNLACYLGLDRGASIRRCGFEDDNLERL